MIASDENELEQFRPALVGHCYRMLGSVFDADDAVQETMLRAWRSFDRFDGRSSVKTWLYRIAINVCLDELKSRGRRARPMEDGSPSLGTTSPHALTQQPPDFWLEPLLDREVVSTEAGPAERSLVRQSIRLAFVAALQHLAPKQRATLLMTEVLDFSAAETAKVLQTSVPAVNSALQRARATLAKRSTEEKTELTAAQVSMLDRYVNAFERYDVAGLTDLMREDVTFCMPPFSMWLEGAADVQAWMLGAGYGCKGSQLVPTFANGWPAFAQYRVNPEGGHRAWALIVLELEGDRIATVNNFLDVDRLFPRFDLPLRLAAR